MTIKVNQALVAVDDEATTVTNVLAFIYALGNDSDSDGSIVRLEVSTAPAHGDVFYYGGGFYYTPESGFVGADTFQYRAVDNDGDSSNVATVTITVDPNQPPTANDDAATTLSGVQIGISAASNDADADGIITDVTSVLAPTHGSLVDVGIYFLYTPDHDFVGTDTFQYVATDNGGFVSNTATVTITVDPNQPPVAGDDMETTISGVPIDVFVENNDIDVDGYVTGTGRSCATRSRRIG